MIGTNRFYRSLALAGLFAILLSVTTFARTDVPRERRITGLIVSIDKSARIVNVRDQNTGRLVGVRVPAGNQVRVLTGLERASNFELLLRGMRVTVVAS